MPPDDPYDWRSEFIARISRIEGILDKLADKIPDLREIDRQRSAIDSLTSQVGQTKDLIQSAGFIRVEVGDARMETIRIDNKARDARISALEGSARSNRNLIYSTLASVVAAVLGGGILLVLRTKP